MTRYQILYWQDLPSQIRAEDEDDEIKILLPQRFQDRIDEAAAERGAEGTDDYLAGWKWGEASERDGTAQEVADAISQELMEKYSSI